MAQNLSIYYQNCRGMRTKMHTLFMNILSFEFDIITLTETWLVPEIYDNEFIDQRYVVFRCDRDRNATQKEDGGGVLIAVKRYLKPSSILSKSNLSHSIDNVIISIPNTGTNQQHIISTSYVINSSSKLTYESHFNEIANILNDPKTDTYVLLGDFNIPTANWTLNDDSDLLLSGSSPICSVLSSFMIVCEAKQFNFIKNHNDRTLDLLLSNINCTVSPVNIPLLPVDPHHPPFSVVVPMDIRLGSLMRLNSRFKYNYHKANYDLINSEISKIDWDSTLYDLPVDIALDKFYEKIYCVIKNHIPQSKPKKSHFPVWFSKSLIHIQKNKKKAWIKWKVYGNLSDYRTFSLYRERFKSERKHCFYTYKERVENSIQKNIKYFWTYIKNRKAKTGIPLDIYYKNSRSTNPELICNLFSSFFSSVFEPSTFNSNSWSPPPQDSYSCDVICNLDFPSEQVKVSLKSLDSTKGPGPDGLPSIFIKHTADSLAKPLHILFTKSLLAKRH